MLRYDLLNKKGKLWRMMISTITMGMISYEF